jgi:hypothetical protein
MVFYVYVFLLLATLAIVNELPLNRNARYVVVFFAYIVLVLFVGLRWETGNDWVPYHDYYASLTNLQDKAADFDIGYRIVSLWGKDLALSYSVFLLLYAGMYLGLVTVSFLDVSDKRTPWLLLLLYSSYLLGWMGTAREVMAIAICLFSLRYVLSRKLLLFLICICLAAMFHASAICFVFAWPLSRVALKRAHIWLTLCILVLCAEIGVGAWLLRMIGQLLHIPSLDAKLIAYQAISVQDMGFAVGNITVLLYLKRLVYLLFFTIFYKKFETASEKLYFNLYLFSLILFVLFLDIIPALPLRLGMYFSVYELFLFVSLIDKFKWQSFRLLYRCGLILLFATRLYMSLYTYFPDLYIPYKGIFINTDVFRSMY